jgi:hypothetical protein
LKFTSYYDDLLLRQRRLLDDAELKRSTKPSTRCCKRPDAD